MSYTLFTTKYGHVAIETCVHMHTVEPKFMLLQVNRFKADCANTTFEAKAEYSSQLYAPTEMLVQCKVNSIHNNFEKQQHHACIVPYTI